MMWDPLLSDAEHTGELRVVASGEGRVNNHQFYLSRRDYLAQHGDIMRRLLTELTHTGQFIDSHRGEAARLLGRAGDRRPVAEYCPRPPQPSPAADGSVGDPRPADHRRSLYALGLIAKPVPVREAVWYGEPAPDVIRPLMAVS